MFSLLITGSSRFFFLFCVYSLGEETVGCDASAFRNVFRSRA